MRGPNFRIKLDQEERETLRKIIRKRTEKQSTVLRAKIILLSDEGNKYQDIAQTLGIRRNMVTDWTTRWHASISKPVLERLQDLPRPGAPDTFTPEQLCKIIALACECPQDYGRPITHWTQRELAEEVIKQGIVESISPGYIGYLLKKKTCSRTVANTGSTQKRMSEKTRGLTIFVAFTIMPWKTHRRLLSVLMK